MYWYDYCPKHVKSRYQLLVFKAHEPFLPLTDYYHDCLGRVSKSSATSYLNSLLPFFTWLETSSTFQGQRVQWNDSEEKIRVAVDVYLMDKMYCKIHDKDTFCFVKLTNKSPNTISRFLSALKSFYKSMIRFNQYPYHNPFIDTQAILQPYVPYYFQYAGKSLRKSAIHSSIRFLLHGLIFETQNGKSVTIKTHLLRHAFATEAVQRQKMPIDIVAKILHQKDLEVTGYYSAPTPTQIAASVSELHDVIASYVDIDDAYIRNPQELQKELDTYVEKVGVFNKVLGGTCVADFVCSSKMQCLGCRAKVPEPDQETIF